MHIYDPINDLFNKYMPERSYEPPTASEMEQNIVDRINSILTKGFQFFETTGKILSPIKTAYNVMWTPYMMLKAPFAFRMNLKTSSDEHNFNTLADITPANVVRSVVTPGIYRQLPWIGLSEDIISKLSNLALYAFPGALIFYPALGAANCIMNGEGFKTLDLSQIGNDAGRCLSESAQIYQGPEAAVRAATSLAVGAMAAVGSQLTMSLILSDWAKKGRYEEADRIYTNVAIYLKNRWDEAVQNQNADEKKYCLEKATKLSTNLDLIENSLGTMARLTTVQVKEIRLKLSWACNYVLAQEKLLREHTQAPASS